jgi:hypothetical protein
MVGVCPDAAVSLLAEHCSTRTDHARALWTLIVLSEWLAQSFPDGKLGATSVSARRVGSTASA